MVTKLIPCHCYHKAKEQECPHSELCLATYLQSGEPTYEKEVPL